MRFAELIVCFRERGVMKNFLLIPISLVLSFYSISVCAVNDSREGSNADAALMRDETILHVPSWFAGGAIGFSLLTGRDARAASDGYYQSVGYYSYPDIPHGWLWGLIADIVDRVAFEGSIYGGYRPRDFLEVELGYAGNYSWDERSFYKNSTTGDTIRSSRLIKARALYLSTSMHPFQAGRGRGLYIKLGGHSSELSISKTVTGTPANLGTIAAGDNLPGDGTSRGHGSLYGLGYDFKTAKYGDVRLEWSHYNRLGGTPYGKSSLNIGYHANF